MSPEISRDAEGVLAEDFKHIGEQRDAGAEEDEADGVEGMGLFAVVGQVEVDQDEAEEADGDVEEEDDAPVQVVDDKAAGEGPSMGPIRAGMETKLMARTSSDLAKVRTSVRRPTGTIMAPPQPCRMRQATRMWMLVERPQSREPRVKMPMAAAKTRRVPKRSAIQPLMGMKTASARV